MKKFQILFLVAFALLLASPAYALQCKAGNYEASDECWVNAKISPLETVPVVAGVVLVADFTDDNANDAAWQVRVSDASADASHVIGVAQRSIATGDIGLILARGKGKIRTKSNQTISSGDSLFASTSQDATISVVTGAKPTAFSLQGQTLSGNTRATIDAYIVVV